MEANINIKEAIRKAAENGTTLEEYVKDYLERIPSSYNELAPTENYPIKKTPYVPVQVTWEICFNALKLEGPEREVYQENPEKFFDEELVKYQNQIKEL